MPFMLKFEDIWLQEYDARMIFDYRFSFYSPIICLIWYNAVLDYANDHPT